MRTEKGKANDVEVSLLMFLSKIMQGKKINSWNWEDKTLALY